MKSGVAASACDPNDQLALVPGSKEEESCASNRRESTFLYMSGYVHTPNATMPPNTHTLRKSVNQATWHTTLIPAFRRRRQVESCESGSSLVYRVKLSKKNF